VLNVQQPVEPNSHQLSAVIPSPALLPTNKADSEATISSFLLTRRHSMGS
jgi:hypothetical protein